MNELVVIPKGITKIKELAFFRADKLKCIVIPDTLTVIGANAFDQNDSLETLYYHGTSTQASSFYINSSGNVDIGTAKRYYYSEEEPTEVSDYWRYVDCILTPW